MNKSFIFLLSVLVLVQWFCTGDAQFDDGEEDPLDDGEGQFNGGEEGPIGDGSELLDDGEEGPIYIGDEHFDIDVTEEDMLALLDQYPELAYELGLEDMDKRSTRLMLRAAFPLGAAARELQNTFKALDAANNFLTVDEKLDSQKSPSILQPFKPFMHA